MTQLYNTDEDITQCISCQVVCFDTYKFAGNKTPSTVLCVASRDVQNHGKVLLFHTSSNQNVPWMENDKNFGSVLFREPHFRTNKTSWLPGAVARLDACPPGIWLVAGLILTSGKTSFRWDLVMKKLLWPFSPFRWFTKGSYWWKNGH